MHRGRNNYAHMGGRAEWHTDPGYGEGGHGFDHNDYYEDAPDYRRHNQPVPDYYGQGGPRGEFRAAHGVSPYGEERVHATDFGRHAPGPSTSYGQPPQAQTTPSGPAQARQFSANQQSNDALKKRLMDRYGCEVPKEVAAVLFGNKGSALRSSESVAANPFDRTVNALAAGLLAEPEHPVEEKEEEELDSAYEWLDGDPELVKKNSHVPGYGLTLFDLSYENSVWDYDPKFTWDYLPDTKRGVKDRKDFVCGEDYIHEEFKWQQYEGLYKRLWAGTYMRKAKEQLNTDGSPNKTLDIRAALASDQPAERAIAWFEENCGVPEDLCQRHYCGICDLDFKSVMPSMKHYLDPAYEHDEWVKQYFLDALYEGGHLDDETAETTFGKALINRMCKLYRTKPVNWKCIVCTVELGSIKSAELHFKGQTHIKKAKAFMEAKSKLLNPSYKIRTPAQKAKMRERRLKYGPHNVVNAAMRNVEATRGGLGSMARAGAVSLVPGELSRQANKHSVHNVTMIPAAAAHKRAYEDEDPARRQKQLLDAEAKKRKQRADYERQNQMMSSATLGRQGSLQ